MKIYTSNYHDIILHENYLEEFWKESSDDMSEDEYKTEMQEYLNAVITQFPVSQKILINLINFRFAIDPELQKWADKNIMAKAQNYVKKAAFLMPQDFFANLSVEQVNSRDGTPQDAIKYFDNREDALEWLSRY